MEQSSHHLEHCKTLTFDVTAIDFCETLRQIYEKHGKVKLVKLDIEGSEFDVLDAIIDKKAYQYFETLLCETHARFFTDGNERLRRLESRLRAENISNIYLDWV